MIDPQSPAHGGNADAERWHDVDVAVDFTSPEAVMSNAPVLAKRGINLVIGTTGWSAHERELRTIAGQAGIGVVAAPNFSTGVVLFEAIAAYAARLFEPQQQFGAFLHEAHHAAKKDAPSGAALSLKRTMEQAGFRRTIDVSSTRAGFIPGIHTIGFDGPAETIRFQVLDVVHRDVRLHLKSQPAGDLERHRDVQPLDQFGETAAAENQLHDRP